MEELRLEIIRVEAAQYLLDNSPDEFFYFASAKMPSSWAMMRSCRTLNEAMDAITHTLEGHGVDAYDVSIHMVNFNRPIKDRHFNLV